MGDEGVAAPLRHPDSDSLTQITASPGPPLTAPPPLLGSLRGTTATGSPPLALSPHYPPLPTRPTLRPPLMPSQDMSSNHSSLDDSMQKGGKVSQ